MMSSVFVQKQQPQNVQCHFLINSHSVATATSRRSSEKSNHVTDSRARQYHATHMKQYSLLITFAQVSQHLIAAGN